MSNVAEASPATVAKGPSGPSSATDDWVHATFGVHPAEYAKPPGGTDAGGPASVPPPGSLGPAGSDPQSQAFRTALQPLLTAIDGHLGYTSEHAEPAKHRPLAARREGVAGAYQPAVAQVDPGDASKAKGAIDTVLADAGALGQQAAQFRQAVEKAFDDWQARQPNYDEAARQVGEMQAWGHGQAAPMQGLIDGVRAQREGRAYAEACAAFDRLLPQLKPFYEDYQKQKAAQEQYEPARKALDPRLAAAAASRFAKLEPMQQAFGPAASEMDNAASAKDFVHALQLETDLAGKVAEYETALDNLQKQKQAFEDAKAATQPKLDQAGQAPPHKKLEPMRQDLAAGQSQMAAAAQAEDFEPALGMAKDLGAKADACNQAAAELEQQKKAYDEAAARVQPRLADASKSSYRQLAPAQAEIAGLQTAMEGSAGDEDYAAALDQANGLSSKLDAFEASVKQIGEKKKQYEDARGTLQPKLESVANPPRPKLQPDEQAIADTTKAMEAAATDEDFESAAQIVGDLGGKADAYADAVKQLDEKKKAYTDSWDKVKPRIDAMNQTRSDSLAPMQQAILSLVEQIDKAAQAEEYDEATKLIETLTRELDDYETADATKIYVVHYKDKDYRGTQQELVAVRLAITVAAIKDVLRPLKSRAEMQSGYYGSLKALNDKQYVIAWVVTHAGGANLESVGAAVAAQDKAIGALEQAINGDPGTAEGGYHAALGAVNAAGKALDTYMDALDVGGARTITVLQAVEVSCFAIAAACGAAILAPAGSALAATVGANAASGAGFGALEEMAKQGAELAGTDGPRDWSGAAVKVGKATLLNGIGGALGSGAGKALKGLVVEQIVERAAIDNPLVKKRIEDFVEGALAGVVQTLVSNSPDIIQGKVTWRQLAVLVAENMLAGGVGGILGNTLPAKRT